MGTKTYPSFPCLIDKPTSILVDSEKPIVISDAFVLEEKQPKSKIKAASAAVSRTYPNFKEELDFLKCDIAHYSNTITDLMQLWLSVHNNVRNYPLKYIPPGYEAEWRKALQEKKAFPEKHFLNVLAINKSIAIIAIKIKESDDFRVAFSFLDGQVPAFYRATPLEFPYIAAACLIGNTSSGFIATAQRIYHFEIAEKTKFRIVSEFDNPTYPKRPCPDAQTQLMYDYPVLLMQCNATFLVVARYNSRPVFIDIDDHSVYNPVTAEVTSFCLTNDEFSCGSSHGVVRTFNFQQKKSGALKLRNIKKLSMSLSKTWNCFGQTVDVQSQDVVLQRVVGRFYIYVLKRAIITIDRMSKITTVNNDIEPVVDAFVFGDLLVTMTASHTLYFTQVGQSVPLKKLSPISEEVVGSPGRTLLYANLYEIWMLCSSGTLIKIELPVSGSR
jgi:hypothetical protein